MEIGVNFLTFTFFLVYGAAASVDDYERYMSKKRVCNDSKILFRETQVELAGINSIYSLTLPGHNTTHCARLCYEYFSFCYTVKYEPNLYLDPDGVRRGMCAFSYWKDSCNTMAVKFGDSVDLPETSARLLHCVTCMTDIEQHFDRQVQVAKSIDDVPGDIFRLNDGLIATPQLKAKCPGRFSFKTQMFRQSLYPDGSTPKLIYPTIPVKSPRECAKACYQSHYCASAIYYKGQCDLAYDFFSCSHYEANWKSLTKAWNSQPLLIYCTYCIP